MNAHEQNPYRGCSENLVNGPSSPHVESIIVDLVFLQPSIYPMIHIDGGNAAACSPAALVLGYIHARPRNTAYSPRTPETREPGGGGHMHV